MTHVIATAYLSGSIDMHDDSSMSTLTQASQIAEQFLYACILAIDNQGHDLLICVQIDHFGHQLRLRSHLYRRHLPPADRGNMANAGDSVSRCSGSQLGLQLRRQLAELQHIPTFAASRNDAVTRLQHHTSMRRDS